MVIDGWWLPWVESGVSQPGKLVDKRIGGEDRESFITLKASGGRSLKTWQLLMDSDGWSLKMIHAGQSPTNSWSIVGDNKHQEDRS